MNRITPWAALALALAAAPALAEKPHSHGTANLSVAIEGRQITIDLETPLDNLVGFERAPRNDAERKRVDAAVQRLRQAAQMFAIDPAAQCTPAKAELTSEVLGLGASAGKADAGKGKHDHGEHADLDASYVFDCADPGKAAYIDVGLFEFGPMARIDVQAVTPKGQLKRTLKRSERRLVLSR